ncbi:hypothetical protein LSAT2_016260 [Lamellibrachia satsuma]|nr:hypothetical protein LSAT2_016260 [Lamellibrachia satsuma]
MSFQTPQHVCLFLIYIFLDQVDNEIRVRQNKEFLDTLKPATTGGSLNDRLQHIEERLDNQRATGEVRAKLDELTSQLASLNTRMLTLETPETSPSPTGSPSRAINRRFRVLQRTVQLLQNKVNRLMSLLTLSECRSSPCRNGGTCIDQFNSFFCRCPSAWQGARCETDVNECSLYAGTDLGCQNAATCVNTQGSFRCQCNANWHGVRCTETHDDCTGASNEALCDHGTCINLPRVTAGQIKYRCLCNEGWTTDGSSPGCTVDVDECSGRQHPCSVNPFVGCINVPGTFYCAQCPPGYSGNGHVCQDINECLTNNGGCSNAPLVSCTNTLGSRQCGACPTGYQGDGVTCRYVGVCRVDNGGCHPLASCSESPGENNDTNV